MPEKKPGEATFLDLPRGELSSCRAAVLPAFPSLEASLNPKSAAWRIIAASAYLELYDEEVDARPSDEGLYTLPVPLVIDGADGKRSFLGEMVGLQEKKIFPLVVADDLLLSAMAMKASSSFDPDVEILFLSGSLPPQDSPWWGFLPEAERVAVIGLKSTRGECFAGRILASARDLMTGKCWPCFEGLGEKVHLSLHPDFFEPAFLALPANREPGGLNWWRVLDLLREIFGSREVVGLDLCADFSEKGEAAADFTLAKLLYKTLAYKLCLPAQNGPPCRG